MARGKSVALAVAITVAVLLTGEWIAAQLEPQSSFRRLHRPRPDLPWLYDLVPGASARAPTGDVDYRIGKHGFRDRDRRATKSPDVFRIAILGDSVTFGFGVPVEDGFVARLEERLAHHENLPGPRNRVEVLNFGVSGFNPYNEAELFRGVVQKYEPDLTLVQFCVNDLNDPRHHFGASTLQRLGTLPPSAFPNAARAASKPWEVSRIAALCDRSSLCRTLLGGLLGPGREPANREEVLDAFEVRADARFATEWDWLRARYDDIAQNAAAVGSEFGVLVFPSAMEIDPEAGTAAAASTLEAIGREEGWTVIDLTPAFRASERGRKDLFVDLWHPTSEGHAIAADAISTELLQGPLLGKER